MNLYKRIFFFTNILILLKYAHTTIPLSLQLPLQFHDFFRNKYMNGICIDRSTMNFLKKTPWTTIKTFFIGWKHLCVWLKWKHCNSIHYKIHKRWIYIKLTLSFTNILILLNTTIPVSLDLSSHVSWAFCISPLFFKE